jgi:peptidoglycan/LPS O-acetylase OafA/YrhL
LDKTVLTGEKGKLYFPQLDSIRGMSFIAIFLFHTLRINYSNNGLGKFASYVFNCLPFAIDVFFILSSFLLTYLALNEYEKRGNFSFKNYFTRRILRIWPLYYFILVLAFLIFPLVANWLHFKMSLPPPFYYLFFIANFYVADHVFFLRLLWTISVEEQFYLLWGICLRFRYKNLQAIIFLFFIVSIAFSLYAIFNGIKFYFNTITYLFDFGSGSLAALYIFKNNKIIKIFGNLSFTGTLSFYWYLPFHFLVFYFLNKNSTGVANDIFELINRYLFILYISFFITEQMVNISRTRIFERARFLIFTGKISYGLYCYHGITILLINLLATHFKIDIANWAIVIIYFLFNYLVATISYYYLEFPFLKLKKKWRRI